MSAYERMMLMLAARQVRLLEALCHAHDLEDVAGERDFREKVSFPSPVGMVVLEELAR